jgi:hypothetical protein
VQQGQAQADQQPATEPTQEEQGDKSYDPDDWKPCIGQLYEPTEWADIAQDVQDTLVTEFRQRADGAQVLTKFGTELNLVLVFRQWAKRIQAMRGTEGIQSHAATKYEFLAAADNGTVPLKPSRTDRSSCSLPTPSMLAEAPLRAGNWAETIKQYPELGCTRWDWPAVLHPEGAAAAQERKPWVIPERLYSKQQLTRQMGVAEFMGFTDPRWQFDFAIAHIVEKHLYNLAEEAAPGSNFSDRMEEQGLDDIGAEGTATPQ